MALSSESYRRDGFVVLRSRLDQETIAACLADLAAARASRPAGASLLAFPPGANAFLDRLASDPRLAGLASELLGDSAPVPVACFGCTYVVKEAGTGRPALWHQDGHPWRERFGIASAVTLWIALDATNAGNGALEVIPGSHTLPAQPLMPAPDTLFGGRIDPSLVDETKAVVLAMAPGDIEAHHPGLIHGSGVNESTRDRRALVLRYKPAEAKNEDAAPG